MSKSMVERPPVYKGPSKIPRFAPARPPLPDIEMETSGGKKPSRLMQLKSDYHDKIMKEKEEKMVRMYEGNQKKALSRVNSNTNKGMVRDFFRERREVEVSNGVSSQIPTMTQHFKQKRNELHKQEETNLFEKRKMPPDIKRGQFGYGGRNTIGRDKSNPLAPIDRNNTSPPIARKPQIHGRPWTKEDKKPKTNQDEFAPRSAPAPFGANPPVELYGPPKTITPSDDTPPPNLNQLKRLQKQKMKSNMSSTSSPGPRNNSKMSDFQKWQAEQDEARSERLRKNRVQSRGDEENVDEGDEDNVVSKQRELMEQIERQKEELERMRRARQREEEEERKEMETRRKREEERRKKAREEAERRKQEADERRQQEEEELATQARRRREEEAQRRLEAESRMTTNRTNRTHRTETTYREHHLDLNDDFIRSDSRHYHTPSPPKHARPVQVKRKPEKAKPIKQSKPQYERAESPPKEFKVDVSRYLDAAKEDGAYENSKIKLVPCPKCGRKFAEDRVQRHVNSCDNLTKKRKVLDPTKLRTAGTEMEQYNRNPASKSNHVPPKKKSNWRQQHENFIQNLRYAKKVTEMEKTGQDLSSLPPPPVQENPDYVQCPICQRSFNPTTAERHIPRCKAPPRRK